MGASALACPRIIAGKYALGRPLGAGSAGSVWEAENLLVGKHVAIKLLRSELSSDARVRARFVAEARAAARIAHANVVDIYDLGVGADGACYMVMELLDGETLEEILKARGKLAPAYACELVLQVLAALTAAHAAGIVHRDLKPANVVVTHPRPDRPLVKVLDFGIARGLVDPDTDRVPPGALLGTPTYMAPEQALGREVDERADIYAAAAILHELLTGRVPYAGETTGQLLARLVRGDRIPLAEADPDLPTALAEAIDAALAHDRDDRTASASDFAAAIAPFVTAARAGSLAPSAPESLPIPLCGFPQPTSALPIAIPAVSESLLVDPRFPRAPALPDSRRTSDEEKALREAPTAAPAAPMIQPKRRFHSALFATLAGFACGMLFAWATGVL